MVCTCCNADSALRWRVGAMKGGKYGMSALCRWVVTGLGLVGFFHQAMIFEVYGAAALGWFCSLFQGWVSFPLGLKMAVLACPSVVGSFVPLRSVCSALCLRAEAGIAARRPPHFLCFAKESKQRKATRSQGHFVVPCAARARWGLAKLAALKQTRALIHLSLRCSALPHGKGGIGCGRACEGTDEISTGGASSGAGGPVLIVLSRALAPHRAAKQPPSVPAPTLPSGTASSADLGGKRARVCLSAASLARPRPS